MRELLGLTGQFAAVDELLTGRENLEMFGRLFHLSRDGGPPPGCRSCWSASTSPTPATEPRKDYSGGMRRRLDLASSLLTQPAGALP